MNSCSGIKGYLLGFLLLAGSIAPVSAALVVNPAMSITHVVTVQPIVVSDDNGANTAEFFGTPAQLTSIEGLIDSIWAQAGIAINFLSPNAWNSTFANWGSSGPPDNGGGARPVSDLDMIISDGITAGVTHADPNVVNMFFVSIPAGFSLLSDNSAAGLARLNGNGISQYVGANLLGFAAGQEVIASVVAHEIGHNLGLDHILSTENLMQAAGSPNPGERLSNPQIATALASNFSIATAAVPLPGAVWLFGAALLSLMGLGRKRLNAAGI